MTYESDVTFPLEIEPPVEKPLRFPEDVRTKLLPGETVDLSIALPLLTPQEVDAQVGFDIGALCAVVQLPARQGLHIDLYPMPAHEGQDVEPYKEALRIAARESHRRMNATTIYCFQVPQGDDEHEAHGADKFLLTGASQIAQLKEYYRGAGPMAGVSGDVVELKRHQTIPVGRSYWLPGVGWEYQSRKEGQPRLRSLYQSVSHSEASIAVNDAGHLLVTRSEGSYWRNWEELFVTTQAYPVVDGRRPIGELVLAHI